MYRRRQTRLRSINEQKNVQITSTAQQLKTVFKSTAPCVVFKWVQADKLTTTYSTGFWGIGDILRGMIATYQLAKKNRWDFMVDIHDHPFSQFLVKPSMHWSVEIDTPSVPFIGTDAGQYHQLEFKFDDLGRCICFHNAWPINPLLNDEKFLVRELLTFKPEFMVDVSGTYNLFHIRVGDKAMQNTVISDFSKYETLLRRHASPGDILITDCAALKRYVAALNMGVIVKNEHVNSAHTGIANDVDELLPTATDMQLIIYAQRIYTYSEYAWVSGFVHWCSVCFDKELIDLK